MKKLLVALLVIVVVVAAAVAVVEIGGRPVLQGYIHDQVVKALPGSDPTVTVGPGSLTLQALSGHLDSVDVDIPDATLGTLESHLTLAAKNVPLDSSKPIGDVAIGVDVSKDQAQQFVRGLKGFEAASVTINTDVSIGSSFELFGQKVPFAIGVTPSADSGELVLTPTSVTISGTKVAVSDLQKLPLAGNIVSLVAPQHVCVAQYLPKVLTLTGATVSGDHLLLTGDGKNIALSTTDFSTVGTC